VLTRSLRGSAIHISPPFVIAPGQIEAMVDALRRALDDARGEEVGSHLRT
jgi:adenosylmethionine-8-amino-7-oxononanoate aminotransferase